MTPYSVALIGTGQQRLVILAPIMEGVTNLIASVVLGYLLGAIGVAYGTLCGAVVGVLANMFYSMPRTTAIRFDMREYLRDGLLRPITFTLPLLLCVAALQLLKVGSVAETMIAFAAVAFAVLILWLHGLFSEERARRLNRPFSPQGKHDDLEKNPTAARRSGTGGLISSAGIEADRAALRGAPS
jgi:O-antigen/teichoic acid export membrane protein